MGNKKKHMAVTVRAQENVFNTVTPVTDTVPRNEVSLTPGMKMHIFERPGRCCEAFTLLVTRCFHMIDSGFVTESAETLQVTQECSSVLTALQFNGSTPLSKSNRSKRPTRSS